VQSYTRHQLKEDKFQEMTRGALRELQAHRQQLTLLAVIVLAIVVAAGAYGFWRNQQDDQASVAMGEAMNTYSAPIVAPGTATDPNQLTFTSAADRDKKAEAQFDAIAQNYPHTQTGKNALYMSAVAALDASQYSDAEAKFKKVANSGGKDLSALAKLGLASVYEATNRDQDAISIYNELMKKPTESVSRARAQFALAALYERTNPAQAKKIYDELAADKSPAVAQIARQRQTTLSGAAK
jgi:predicted negative regulator of RcsB-dependent stress response